MEEHELQEVLKFSHKKLLTSDFSKDIKMNIKENVQDPDNFVMIKGDVLINCVIYFYINAFKYKIVLTKIILDKTEFDLSFQVFLNLETKRLKATPEYRNQIINETIKTMNRDFPEYTKYGFSKLFNNQMIKYTITLHIIHLCV